MKRAKELWKSVPTLLQGGIALAMVSLISSYLNYVAAGLYASSESVVGWFRLFIIYYLGTISSWFGSGGIVRSGTTQPDIVLVPTPLGVLEYAVAAFVLGVVATHIKNVYKKNRSSEKIEKDAARVRTFIDIYYGGRFFLALAFVLIALSWLLFNY